MDSRNELLEKILSAIAGSTPAITTMVNTRASVGNSVLDNGVLGPISITGAGDDALPPPSTPQPATGGSYNNYVQITGFTPILQGGEISTDGSETTILSGGAGDYRSSHAWLDISTSANNNVIGFIFAVQKASDGLVHFGRRVTGERGSAQDQPTNISGGGFLPDLEVGDKVTLWAACSLSADLTIYDGDIGLEMACPAILKGL